MTTEKCLPASRRVQVQNTFPREVYGLVSTNLTSYVSFYNRFLANRRGKSRERIVKKAKGSRVCFSCDFCGVCFHFLPFKRKKKSGRGNSLLTSPHGDVWTHHTATNSILPVYTSSWTQLKKISFVRWYIAHALTYEKNSHLVLFSSFFFLVPRNYRSKSSFENVEGTCSSWGFVHWRVKKCEFSNYQT